jgi:hypothetical protein
MFFLWERDQKKTNITNRDQKKQTRIKKKNEKGRKEGRNEPNPHSFLPSFLVLFFFDPCLFFLIPICFV